MLSQKEAQLGLRRATFDIQTETPVRRIPPRVHAQLGHLRQRSIMLLLLQKQAQVGLRRANQVQLDQQRTRV